MRPGLYTIRRLFALIMVMMMVLSQGALVSYAAGETADAARRDAVNSIAEPNGSADSLVTDGSADQGADSGAVNAADSGAVNAADNAADNGAEHRSNKDLNSSGAGSADSKDSADRAEQSGSESVLKAPGSQESTDTSDEPGSQDPADSSEGSEPQDASGTPGLLGSPGTPEQSGHRIIYNHSITEYKTAIDDK